MLNMGHAPCMVNTNVVAQSVWKRDLNMTKIEGVKKDQILEALPGLSASDLTMIQATITGLLGGRIGNVAAPAGTLAAPLFEALCGAVNATVPLSNIVGTPTGKTFQKHVPPTQQFLDRYFKGWDRQAIVQMAFLRMLMELLCEDLKTRGAAPTVGVMVTNLLRLPEIFENAYPGYLDAGLGDMVLRHFTKVRLSAKAQVGRKKPRRI